MVSLLRQRSIVASIVFTKLLFAFVLLETQQCGLSEHLRTNAKKKNSSRSIEVHEASYNSQQCFQRIGS